jgi:hypothetical protein
MKAYTLKPTHGKTVRFTGQEIASASGRRVAGREQNRWTDLTLYRTKGGRYILDIDYTTQWEGEQCSQQIHVCNSAAAVVDQLTDEQGELGRLDTELLQRAAENDPAFDAANTELVD